ncbi:acetyl-CoA carboxylase biotin carboxylase subunit family protein [Paenibacillus sp. GCM10012307]|uniref:ATP-grasp domain-containing protein n=1 Tax=Paenibacillus roseus TaxID=2798579 RepID=A0A934J4B6_9BACL|nr:ATP-grasp domain-containing protein [Paenibacillus roseus]MBJ6360576.1 ATP-grasp domain-containing protein [Paenibacillus roseus]
MNRSVILVESGNRGVEIPSFRKLGFYVIFLTAGVIPYDQENIDHATKIITDRGIVQHERLVEIISELHNSNTIETICSTSDFFIPSVCQLCEHYGYRSLNSGSALTFHHKDKFRASQKELHYNVPEFYAFEDLTAAVQFYNKAMKKEWIFKPINGNESVAVQLIKSEQELRDCYKQLNYLSRYTGSLLKSRFLLEEYIEGNIYSCEFMASGSQLQMFGVTNRLMSELPYFVELGYTFPIHGDIAEMVVEETKRFVQDFQYDFGPCHIEYIVSPENKIYILEVNPRLVGPPNPWMIDHALGISIFDIVCSLYVTGEMPDIAFFDSKYTTCLEVTSPVSGYMNRLNIEEKYLNRNDIHIILLKEKEEYINSATSNTDILARVLTVSCSIQEAQKLAKEIYESIRLEVSVQPLALSIQNDEWSI